MSILTVSPIMTTGYSYWPRLIIRVLCLTLSTDINSHVASRARQVGRDICSVLDLSGTKNPNIFFNVQSTVVYLLL